MKTGSFYYITDEYYTKFSNCGLMGNKEEDEFGKHGRPCYYCFEQSGFYWMIPISSKVEKYKKYTMKKWKDITVILTVFGLDMSMDRNVLF